MIIHFSEWVINHIDKHGLSEKYSSYTGDAYYVSTCDDDLDNENKFFVCPTIFGFTLWRGKHGQATRISIPKYYKKHFNKKMKIFIKNFKYVKKIHLQIEKNNLKSRDNKRQWIDVDA